MSSCKNCMENPVQVKYVGRCKVCYNYWKINGVDRVIRVPLRALKCVICGDPAWCRIKKSKRGDQIPACLPHYKAWYRDPEGTWWCGVEGCRASPERGSTFCRSHQPTDRDRFMEVLDTFKGSFGDMEFIEAYMKRHSVSRDAAYRKLKEGVSGMLIESADGKNSRYIRNTKFEDAWKRAAPEGTTSKGEFYTACHAMFDMDMAAAISLLHANARTVGYEDDLFERRFPA